MGTYAVTGAASGIGQATAERLRREGHTVVGVDLRDTDVVADLSTPAGRRAAAGGVLESADGRLDGAVLAAGLGGIPGRDRLILEVNHLGVVELLDAWRPALAASGDAQVVVIGSNSTTLTPLVPSKAVRALLDGDVDRALQVLRRFRGRSATFAYACSKLAVTRWARRAAVTPEWAGNGVRINVLAPGVVATPLLDEQLAGGERAAVEGLAVPVERRGDPDEVAEVITFLLRSPAARFFCGAVLFYDGGSDAYFRTDDWPVSGGLRHVVTYLRGANRWKRRRRG
jgi:NAD(P)-dependent dehydrogenase (short-subunit alcohol dehydrogenase family)